MEPEADVPLEAQARWRGAVREAAKQQRQRKLRRWFASAAAAVVAIVGIGMAFTLKGAPKQSATPYIEEEAAEAVMDESVVGVIDESAAGLALASNAVARNVRGDEAPGALVEADGAAEAEDAGAADEADEAEGEAAGRMAPACQLALQVEDVSIACDRVRDLAQEYEAVADVQAAGDGGANVYVEIAAENAGDFLSAVAPMDRSGGAVEVPEVTGSGQVLVLLALHS